MKQLLVLFLLFNVIGCNPTKTKNQDELELEKEHVESLKRISGDLSIIEHELSMYNDDYLMRITPFVDSSNFEYQSHILLIKHSDTIFNKQITIDSLLNSIERMKIMPEDSLFLKAKIDYELSRITLNGIRSYNLYFNAELKSIKGDKDLHIMFVIKYLYEMGKLSVGRISVEDKIGPHRQYENTWKGEVIP